MDEFIMGTETKLSCVVILNDEDKVKFKQLFKNSFDEIFNNYEVKDEDNIDLKIYNHDFFRDGRHDYITQYFDNIINNKLTFEVSVKNYDNVIEKFYDFLQTLDCEIIRFCILYEENWHIMSYSIENLIINRWWNFLTKEWVDYEI